MVQVHGLKGTNGSAVLCLLVAVQLLQAAAMLVYMSSNAIVGSASWAVISSFFRTTISSKATSCEHDERVGVARVCCAARLALPPKALLGLLFGEVLLATGSLHEPTNGGQLPWQAWAMPVAVRWRSTSRSKALVSRSSRPKASAKRLWSLVNALSSAFTSACQGTMAPSPDCSECMWSWPRPWCSPGAKPPLRRGLRAAANPTPAASLHLLRVWHSCVEDGSQACRGRNCCSCALSACNPFGSPPGSIPEILGMNGSKK